MWTQQPYGAYGLIQKKIHSTAKYSVHKSAQSWSVGENDGFLPSSITFDPPPNQNYISDVRIQQKVLSLLARKYNRTDHLVEHIEETLKITDGTCASSIRENPNSLIQTDSASLADGRTKHFTLSTPRSLSIVVSSALQKPWFQKMKQMRDWTHYINSLSKRREMACHRLLSCDLQNNKNMKNQPVNSENKGDHQAPGLGDQR